MSEVSKLINGTKITLCRGDITRQEVDAIVNAANSGLLGGGGVDGAIHRAGGAQILEECKQIRNSQGQCAPGNAVITSGGNLKAKYVIHAVGPIWRGGQTREAETLSNAYSNSLALARDYDLRSVSFPSISTGAYGYPIESAAETALQAINAFCQQNPGVFDEIRFVLFDQLTFDGYAQALNNCQPAQPR